MYCPTCETEYRDGFVTCSDCDTPLVHMLSLPLPPRDLDAPAGDVEVFRCEDPLEAELVAGALAEAGIRYTIRSQMAGGLQLTAIETHWAPGQSRVLLVPSIAAAHAQQVVASIVVSAIQTSTPFEHLSDTDWRETRKRTITLIILVPFLLTLLSAIISVVQGLRP